MCTAKQLNVVGTTYLQGSGKLTNESDSNSTSLTMYLNHTYSDIYSTQLHTIVVPCVFSLIVLLGIMGHLLVCYVIFSKPSFRTVTNLLLLNLSVADISFLLVCGSFTVVHYSLTVWPFGDVLCRLTQYLLYVTCYVNIYTLVAVSFVRCMIIIYGPHATFIRSKENITKLIIAIWGIFFIAKIPILIVHGVSLNEDTGRVECIISGRKDAQNLFATFFVFAYALPLAIICMLYFGAVCYLRQRKNLIQKKNGQENRKNGRAVRVTKVVTLVVAVFAICWLPLHIHLLVAYFGTIPKSRDYQILLFIWHSLVYVNSVLNPIIYNIFSKEFRKGFIEVACQCRKPPAKVYYVG